MTGRGGEETIEGIALFKYLGRPLEQSYDSWPAVRRNIGRAQQVWSIIGVILRREGVDMIASAEFYISVVQAVIFFRLKTWVFSEAMEKRIVGVHTGGGQQVTGKRAKR